jgi:hypothetical protein
MVPRHDGLRVKPAMTTFSPIALAFPAIGSGEDAP